VQSALRGVRVYLSAGGYDFHPLAGSVAADQYRAHPHPGGWTADPGTGPGLYGCDAPAEA
jgi:hypothetical protein